MRVGEAVVGKRVCWRDKVKEWTFLPMPELLTMVCDIKKKKKEDRYIITAESACSPSPLPFFPYPTSRTAKSVKGLLARSSHVLFMSEYIFFFGGVGGGGIRVHFVYFLVSVTSLHNQLTLHKSRFVVTLIQYCGRHCLEFELKT